MIDISLTWPTLLSSVKKNGVHLIFYKSPKVFLSQILSWTNTGVGGHVCSKLDLRRSFYNNHSWCCDHNKWYFKLCITDLQRGGGGVGSRWRATTRTSTPCSAWISLTSPRSRETSAKNDLKEAVAILNKEQPLSSNGTQSLTGRRH